MGACQLESPIQEEDWAAGSLGLSSPAVLGLLAPFVFTTEVLFRAIPAPQGGGSSVPGPPPPWAVAPSPYTCSQGRTLVWEEDARRGGGSCTDIPGPLAGTVTLGIKPATLRAELCELTHQRRMWACFPLHRCLQS